MSPGRLSESTRAGTRPGDVALSVVVPAYNERRHVTRLLEAVRALAAGQAGGVELLVVDDGSTDDTAGELRRQVRVVYADEGGFEFESGPLCGRVLIGARNRGKGFAVRRGMLAAGGERVLMCDADLSAPLEELPRLVAALEGGCDIAIGSRDRPGARLDPPQPPGRRLAARVFRGLRRRLLLPEVRDTQCGFKLFTRAAAQAVFSRCTQDGWLFDCEALAIAAWLGLRIGEVGILWRDDPDSRVAVWPFAFTAVPTLLSIRRRWGRGGSGAQ